MKLKKYYCTFSAVNQDNINIIGNQIYETDNILLTDKLIDEMKEHWRLACNQKSCFISNITLLFIIEIQ